MTRRALRTTTAALTVAAALLITACGGGDDGSSDGIEGAGKVAGSPAASASGPAPKGAERPDVSVPKDLVLDFDFEKPSDQNSAAALEDAANCISALNHGITKQDPADPAFQFYSSGQAARYAHAQIEEYVDGGWTLTGKDRYYDAKVSPRDETEKTKTVSVAFCEDQSKVFGRGCREQEGPPYEGKPGQLPEVHTSHDDREAQPGVARSAGHHRGDVNGMQPVCGDMTPPPQPPTSEPRGDRLWPAAH
ncbi:hypothetical protein ABZ281_39980 [Streptomyces sp. NPDC006265]|uniref:hypothetical protein n=1 Tax=Streptomyces sp. NPDC006265 TaxID=3156740 RepID=UPI0033A39F26